MSNGYITNDEPKAEDGRPSAPTNWCSDDANDVKTKLDALAVPSLVPFGAAASGFAKIGTGYRVFGGRVFLEGSVYVTSPAVITAFDAGPTSLPTELCPAVPKQFSIAATDSNGATSPAATLYIGSDGEIIVAKGDQSASIIDETYFFEGVSFVPGT